MTAQTLSDIVLITARRYGNAVSGAATDAGSTTSLTDANNLIQPANTWVNHYVRFSSGPNNGAERLITTHSTTNQIGWSPAVNTAVASGDTYTILPRQWVDFETAVKSAIISAGTKWLQTKEHTIPFVNNVAEYSLPEDTLFVVEAFIGDPSNYEWFPMSNWDVAGAPGSYKLIMRTDSVNRYLTPTPSVNKIRMSYVTTMTMMTSSTSTTNLGALVERDAINYIIEYSLYVLHEQAMTRNITGTAARAHFTQSRNHLQEALRIKEMANAIHKVPQRVKTRRIPTHI